MTFTTVIDPNVRTTPYTMQEAFDTVLVGIRGQNYARSIHPDAVRDAMCAYRGPNGIKCAAGHLIPDSDYRRDFEGERARPSMSRIMERLPMQFLIALQELHDDAPILAGHRGYAFNTVSEDGLTLIPEKWEEEMKKLASTWKLIYTPPITA